MQCKGYFHSPIGLLEILGKNGFIHSISFVKKENLKNNSHTIVIENCIKQLQEYFQHKRQKFDLPILQNGSSFQNAIWKEMATIPFAKTLTYKQLASKINKPQSARATGMACSKNKIPIVVPCHRVIGSNGKLTGYAGGLWRKKWLLNHELKNKL